MIHIVNRGAHNFPIRPKHLARTVRVEAVVGEGLARLGEEDGQAVLAAAPQEQGEQPPLGVHADMMPGEPAETDGLLPHIGRHLAVPLDGVLHIALSAQVLLVCAVRPTMPGAVAAHGEEALPGDDVPLQQPLAQADEVPPGGEQPRMAAGLRVEHGRLGVVGEARFRPAEDVLPPLDAVLPVAGNTETSSPLFYNKCGICHVQRKQNAPLERLVVALPCRPLDDIAQHHGVHVGVGAAGHGPGLDGVEPLQGLLRGGRGVHAARGGQTHLKAQDGVHAHPIQVGEPGRIRRDGPAQIQLALGLQPHDKQPGEQLGQTGQVKDRIRREGDVFCFIRPAAVGREGGVRRAAGHGQPRHDAGFLREIGDGIM